jgi:hypothetical protein
MDDGWDGKAMPGLRPRDQAWHRRLHMVVERKDGRRAAADRAISAPGVHPSQADQNSPGSGRATARTGASGVPA